MKIEINIPDYLISEVLTYLIKKGLSFEIAKAKRSERPTAEALKELIRSKNGNVTQTANHYGVSRMTVYRWSEDYAICLDTVREE